MKIIKLLLLLWTEWTSMTRKFVEPNKSIMKQQLSNMKASLLQTSVSEPATNKDDENIDIY